MPGPLEHGEDDAGTSERRSKDKKKNNKSSRKRKSGKDKDGPVLRERTPPSVEEDDIAGRAQAPVYRVARIQGFSSPRIENLDS